jgi:hypothetical protein
VVTLVIREVVLEQMESFVDGLGQPELPHEELDGTDAAAGDAPGLGGGLVVDVGRGDDRPGRGRRDRAVEWGVANFPGAILEG